MTGEYIPYCDVRVGDTVKIGADNPFVVGAISHEPAYPGDTRASVKLFDTDGNAMSLGCYRADILKVK